MQVDGNSRARREAKRAAAGANTRAQDELNERLDSKEREKDLKLSAEPRDRAGQYNPEDCERMPKKSLSSCISHEKKLHCLYGFRESIYSKYVVLYDTQHTQSMYTRQHTSV